MCPKCDSNDYSKYLVEPKDEDKYWYCTCNECGYKWEEDV